MFSEETLSQVGKKITKHCYKIFLLKQILTLFRMDIFGAAHGLRGGGGAKRPPLLNVCHTYPTMMTLHTVIPYLNKIQKIYESNDTPIEFADVTGNQQVLLQQETQI